MAGMNRRGFFGRLFGAAGAAVAPALVKAAMPAAAARPLAPLALCGTYVVTMQLPHTGETFEVPVGLGSPQQEALERFDREWARLRGACLLEGGK